MQDDIPVLDRNQVNELIGNNQDIIKQVFAISFDILPGRMNALEDAILSGDCDDVYRVVHAMYGTISTIGGMRVSAMAKEMENLSRDGDIKALASRLPAFKNAFRELLEAMHECIEE